MKCVRICVKQRENSCVFVIWVVGEGIKRISMQPSQKENETLQQRAVHDNQQMDDYLAKELETQNTCPICYDLMVGDGRSRMST